MTIRTDSYEVVYSPESDAQRIRLTISTDREGLPQSVQFLIPVPPEQSQANPKSLRDFAYAYAAQLLQQFVHHLESDTQK